MSATKKATLKRLLGEGGAGLDRSNGSDRLYDVLKAIVGGLQNRVISGLSIAAPTTPSTQATGASGALAWRVNIAALIALVAGIGKSIAAQADFVVYSGASVVTNGQSVIASLVLKDDGTTIAVRGAAATTGSQVAPTQDEIQAAVGFYDAAKTKPKEWVLLGNTTLNRTADTTVTQAHDMAVADYGGADIVLE
jgi:hypothetical protein